MAKRRFILGVEEQQPFRIQVVEWSGLVASSFQFFGRIAAVFTNAYLQPT